MRRPPRSRTRPAGDGRRTRRRTLAGSVTLAALPVAAILSLSSPGAALGVAVGATVAAAAVRLRSVVPARSSDGSRRPVRDRGSRSH